MFKVCFPHQNLGCLGLIVGNWYLGDISLPHREGFGWSWGRLIRIYWKTKTGDFHNLYLPSFHHYVR